MKGMSYKAQKEREKLIEKREFLERSEEDLNEQETKGRTNSGVTDKFFNVATSKLDDAWQLTP